MTQDKAHPTPAVAVPSEREAEETDLTLVYMCGFSDGKRAALATPPSLPAAQAVEGVEAVLKDIRWRLDDIRDMLMKENGHGDRIYGCDEWSTPVVNLQTAIRVVDRAIAAASQEGAQK